MQLALSRWLLPGVSCATPLPIQTKKGPAVPSCAGDGAGDGGERLIWTALVLKSVLQHGHDVLDTLVLSHQLCAGQWSIVRPNAPQYDIAAVKLLTQRRQPRYCLGLQSTIRQFLKPISQ